MTQLPQLSQLVVLAATEAQPNLHKQKEMKKERERNELSLSLQPLMMICASLGSFDYSSVL